MLCFANLNEAWDDVKKIPEVKRQKKTRSNIKLSTITKPIMFHITDPTLIQILSKYNDTYKHEIIMNILQKEFSPKEIETSITSSFFSLINFDIIDDEYKEIITIVLISVLLLLFFDKVNSKYFFTSILR
jgi:hypothetical protein